MSILSQRLDDIALMLWGVLVALGVIILLLIVIATRR